MSKRIIIATVMRPEGDTGVQTHFRSVFYFLKRQGKSVELVTPFDAPKWMVLPIFAVRRLIYPINSTLSVWWYRHWHAYFLKIALKKILMDGGECVVYAQCPLSAEAALKSRISSAQRVVLVIHFNISQADEWSGKGKIQHGGRLFNSIRKLEGHVLPSIDGLVFVSSFAKNEVAKLFPSIANVPSRVIPNFLADPGVAVTSPVLQGDLICVGTLEPRKNQGYAIEIVAAAKNFGSVFKLTIVGDGVDRAALEHLAAKLGVSELVTFAGYVKNGAELLLNHRAILHVARMESFGIVLLESMARGLPVFAPAVGGIPEVFNDGIEGGVIPLDDAESAATIIIEWLDNKEKMKHAGIAARFRYQNMFSESVVAQELTEFLEG